MFSHIRGHELVSVIDGGYGRLSLGDVGVVKGVAGDEQHFWSRFKHSRYTSVVRCVLKQLNSNTFLCLHFRSHQATQASSGTGFGRKYGSLFQPLAGM